MIEDAIFLSVKPRFADAILAGTKTVELRRTKPQEVGEGSLIVLYASSPVSAVLGSVRVNRIVVDAPDVLWDFVGAAAGITRDEFDAYFLGADEAVGIFVESPATASDPYSLEEIRRDWPAFHPPQAFRYLRTMGDWAADLLKRMRLAGGGAGRCSMESPGADSASLPAEIRVGETPSAPWNTMKGCP